MADESPLLDLQYIITGDTDQEVRANETFNRIEMVAIGSVLDRDLDAPPSNPSDGDRYIVNGLELTIVSAVNNDLIVSGDQTSRIDVGDFLHWENNQSGNDGDYSVQSLVFNSPNTEMVVNEVIPSGDTSGELYHVDGAWTGKVGVGSHYGKIAAYYTGWIFIRPDDGLVVQVVDERIWLRWDSTVGAFGEWVPGVPLPVIADDTARDALKPTDGLLIFNAGSRSSNPLQWYDANAGFWRNALGTPV